MRTIVIFQKRTTQICLNLGTTLSEHHKFCAIVHLMETCLPQDTTENSRAPPICVTMVLKWRGVYAILIKCVIVVNFLNIFYAQI